MKTLSVVLIAKNSQQTIAKAIESAAWADEVILLDSGSDDETIAIAESLGTKCFTHTDWQGYGKQRQIAQSYANCDYVFMLDTDEQITPELKQSIQQVLQQPTQANIAYQCPRRNWFIGRYMMNCGWYPDKVIRLYLREERQYNDNLVHEALDTTGAAIEDLHGDLLHQTAPDYIDFQYKQLKYADSWAKQRFESGKRCSLFSAFSHATAAFLKSYLLRKGFLDGSHGLLLSRVITQYTFNKYAALWALGQSEKS
ncbi:glycosyltransferase family 2 protein [Vibrio intestinalis]|uniref:glycosyltransferase family 2 protein n=1 Tax=Vibrio intestinalis TaxID=2933291 RepID=UPI0021A7A7BA|nr:glycosyltransferase family 2 protein [Vibrio intestinalis]